MPAATRILIVEDEPALAGLLATTLRTAAHDVVLAQNAQQALAALSSSKFDAMVLDWMMPGMSGLELLLQLRQQATHRFLPVLMLTAKALEADKVAGLEAGADDYLSKPFSPRELNARIKALLRRAQPLRVQTALTVGAISLHPDEVSVSYHVHGMPPSKVVLSHTEFKLLHCLMLHPQRVHSREHLLAQAWDHASPVDVRTIDAHVKRLRQSLALAGCEGYVHTVRGVGYTLQASP